MSTSVSDRAVELGLGCRHGVVPDVLRSANPTKGRRGEATAKSRVISRARSFAHTTYTLRCRAGTHKQEQLAAFAPSAPARASRRSLHPAGQKRAREHTTSRNASNRCIFFVSPPLWTYVAILEQTRLQRRSTPGSLGDTKVFFLGAYTRGHNGKG